MINVINVLQMVDNTLKNLDALGLINHKKGCSCPVSDLANCGSIKANCEADGDLNVDEETHS